MIDHLPEDLRAALAQANTARQRRASRRLLHVNDRAYPILRSWPGGFAIDAADLGPLRGQVEITDGVRDAWLCLIIASRIEGDMLICDFKRITAARRAPPVDYPTAKTTFAALPPPT